MSDNIFHIRYKIPFSPDSFKIVRVYHNYENKDLKKITGSRNKINWFFFIERDDHGSPKPYSGWNSVMIDLKEFKKNDLYETVISSFVKSNCFINWKRDNNIEKIIDQ